MNSLTFIVEEYIIKLYRKGVDNMDINLVSHAKDYIDALAMGIDPLSKKPVSENDIVNDLRIARCLFYVSDVLGKVIENGGVNAKKVSKPKLEDFNLEKISLDAFKYSLSPISVSIITKMINELRPETMKKLKVTAITNWLVDIGILTIVQENGKNQKQPTENAESVGITVERREGQYGPYCVVLYNESAQHFIIDNLSAVVDGGYNNKSSKSLTNTDTMEEKTSNNELPY